ncbi:CD209 antigen-like protein C [Betta splendens]|uniref:CD209 antigen-like protein C n=1 Tax=Betta splendens TaxID=158456 RepID=A0A9W2XHA8_BETSP|nr:CD209 antigen-like protein C [Betta splendens]
MIDKTSDDLSDDMDDIYVNVEDVKSVDSRPPSMPPSSQTGAGRFHGALLILGLLNVLLLSGLIGLGVCFVEVCSITANLTERLQDSNKQVFSLDEDRERLRANLSEVTEERNKLRRLFTQRWTMFNNSLYFLSNEPGSWTKGRDDCIKREAHLVVIDSDKEQRFLSGLTKEAAWIGLTDRDKEGTWGWISGAPLTVRYWWKNQPDNGGKGLVKEDCAHISAVTAEWNDLPCERSLLWICEKTCDMC